MKPVKILLVEDEAIVAMQIERDLKAMGYMMVGIYASGEKALVGVETVIPDLVLMDIKLQGVLDGIETASRLVRGHDIPVIFLTAHSEESTISRAKTASPYGYLLKPVDAQELHVAIQRAILDKQNREPPAKMRKNGVQVD